MKTRLSLLIVFLMILYLPGNTQNCFTTGEIPVEYEMFDVYVCYSGFNDSEQPFVLNKRAVVHSTVEFHLVSTLPADNLEIDFDNNQGFQSITVGDVVPVNYSQAGYKTIRFKDASGIFQSIDFQVKESTFPYVVPDLILEAEVLNFQPPCPGTYSTDTTAPLYKYTQPSDGSARGYVRLGNGNTTITRPLFFVDGLNLPEDRVIDPNTGEIIRFGNLGWDVITRGIDETFIPPGSGEPEIYAEIPQMFDEVTMEGYDIIFVDFEDGADYIQKNALLLIDLIQQVNALKTPVNGCTYENIVVGASMGGIISRYALATMEQTGEDHETRTFVSFDSPHKGANISLGLQSFVWFFSEFYDPEQAQSSAVLQSKGIWNDLNRPAPRQLLVENLFNGVQDGNINISVRTIEGFVVDCCESINNYYDTSLDYSCLREGLVTELETLGFPELTLNGAIANGSADLTTLFSEGARLLNVEKWVNVAGIDATVFQAHIWALNGEDYEFEDDDVSFDDVLFHGKIPIANDFAGLPIDFKVATVYLTPNADYPPYDHAPGGKRADLVLQIVPGLEANPDIANSIHYYEEYTSFIPTTSALAIETDDLFFPIADNFLDPLNPDPSLTPFQLLEFQNPINEYHVEATQENRDWFNNKARDINEEDLAFDPFLGVVHTEAEYNYGLYRKRIPSVTIDEGGQLRVNDAGQTAYRDEAISSKEVFEAYIYNSCGQPSLVTVNQGGQFILGSDPEDTDNKRADVFVRSGAKVHIKENGILSLQKGSRLIIEDGGELILDNDAQVDLWWPESTIHIKSGGKLTINGEFVFSGSGYFQFDPGNELAVNSVAFSLAGENASTRFIRLNKGAELIIPSGKNLDLSKGLVEFNDFSKIKVNQGAVDLSYISFEGVSPFSGEGLLIENGTGLLAVACQFHNLTQCLALDGYTGTAFVNLDYCTFNDFQYKGLIIDGCSEDIFIKNSSFTTTSAFTAIELADTRYTRLYNTSIESEDHADDAIGLRLKTARITVLDQCDILACDIGIDGRQQTGPGEIYYNNVDLINQTTIRDCNVGVFLEGAAGISDIDRNHGRLYMDCAHLIQNDEYAIQGTDILLTIDALNNSNCDDINCTHLRPNTFERANVSDDWFNICYEDYSEIDEVFARGNFWGNAQNPTSSYYIISPPANCGVVSANLPLNYVPAYVPGSEGLVCAASVGDPGPFPTDDKMQTCGMDANIGDSTKIDEHLFKGFYYLKQDSLSEAIQEFTYVATVDDANIPTDSTQQICQQKVAVARTFVAPSSGESSAPVIGEWGQDNGSYQKNQLTIAPNPSGGYITVRWQTEQQPDYLEVFNHLGQSMFQRSLQTSDEMVELNLEALEEGMYFIHLVGTDSRILAQERVIIQ